MLKHEDFDIFYFTIGISPFKNVKTQEGIESDLAVSYLCRHVIVKEFLKRGFDTKTLPKQKPRVFLMGGPGLSVNPALEDINWESSFSSISAHVNTHIFNEALVHYLAKYHPEVDAFGLYPGFIYTSGFSSLISNPTLSNIIGKIIDQWFQTKEGYVQNVLVPLLVNPNIISGQLFNSVGNEIVPNSWIGEDVTKRSTLIVKLNDELLIKYNLMGDSVNDL